MTKKTISTMLLILGLLSADISMAQPGIEIPEYVRDIQGTWDRALNMMRQLPDVIERIWQEEVLPIWRRMYDWFYVNIWLRIKAFFEEVCFRIKREFQRREPEFEEELEKEKEELKQEAPEIGKSLWERLKDLWR